MRGCEEYKGERHDGNCESACGDCGCSGCGCNGGAGGGLYIELRELGPEHVETVQQLADKTESDGVLKAQLATSQSDLAAMTDAAGKSSASVLLFASQASAALSAASDAKAKAIQQSAGYQKQIDMLTERTDHPTTEQETCDAALDRLRSTL